MDGSNRSHFQAWPVKPVANKFSHSIILEVTPGPLGIVEPHYGKSFDPWIIIWRRATKQEQQNKQTNKSNFCPRTFVMDYYGREKYVLLCEAAKMLVLCVRGTLSNIDTSASQTSFLVTCRHNPHRSVHKRVTFPNLEWANPKGSKP